MIFSMNCTINDIADALNLSRNTVSKVINGKSGVSPKTKDLIIKKANEMGFGQFGDSVKTASQKDGTILLLARNNAYAGFWMEVMEGIKKELKNTPYSETIGIVSSEEIEAGFLPPVVYTPGIKGIIITEICNVDMCRKILSLGIPTVSVDMPVNGRELIPELDVVTMENKRNVKLLMEYLIKSGHERFSFVGDLVSKNVGDGFMKRYEAFSEALNLHGLKEYSEGSILDKQINTNSIAVRIKSLEKMPECFICGNDSTAIQLIQALNFCEISVPRDVFVAGFDDIEEARDLLPSLTTIATPRPLLGKEAARLLIDKINNPSRCSMMVEVSTELKIRESTQNLRG